MRKPQHNDTIGQGATAARPVMEEPGEADRDPETEEAGVKSAEAANHAGSRGRDVTMSFSRALDAAGQSLEDDGLPGAAGYARAAGKGLASAATEIEHLEISKLTNRVETFMHERPLATAGLFAFTGFVLVGAFRAMRRHPGEDDDVQSS